MFKMISVPSIKTDVVALNSSSIIFVKSIILFNKSQDPRTVNVWIYTNQDGEFQFGRYDLEGFSKIEDSPDYPIELVQSGDAIRANSNSPDTVNMFVTGDAR